MGDVVLAMITKDSLKRVGSSIFANVLDSTLQIPYKTLILIDDGADDTASFVRNWLASDKELLMAKSNLYGYAHPTRATARQTAIDMFRSNFREEWLMFVDDDVVLNPGWWDWVSENKVLENLRVGEVWGINWDISPQREMFLSMFGIDLQQYLVRKFHERGGCHDTLYRRGAIDGIRIPPELHVYEDAYLHYYVSRKGWESAINPVGVKHYHQTGRVDLRSEKEKARIAIKAAVKYGIIEYETMRLMKKSRMKMILAYLSLLRPLLGFFPMLTVTVRIYGVGKGLSEAIKGQYLKVWFRWQVLRSIQSGAEVPDSPGRIIQEAGSAKEL
jgi:glycosyltransferase involved in cell wall biosynthesis